jgi:hypothetical protein
MSENQTQPGDENFDPTDAELQAVEKFAKTSPQNLPPQFNGDPEKFIKSYKDMRAEITRLQQKAKQPTPEPKTEDKAEPSIDNLQIPEKKEPAPTNEDWGRWEGELNATGILSEESRNSIKQRFGMPDSVIDGYVSGYQLKLKQTADKAASLVGGQENLKSVVEWAQSTLNDAERESVNNALKSPGWENVLIGLKARMDQSSPTKDEPRNYSGFTKAGVSNAIEPFANKREMVAAMQDPRYKTDSKYQEWVYAKIRSTSNLKVEQ